MLNEFVLNPLTPQYMYHIFSRIVLTYTINRSVSTSFSFSYCDLLAVPGQLSPGSTSPQNLVGPPQPVLVLQFDLHQFHGWKHSSNPRDWQRHFLLEMMMVAPTEINHLLKQFCFPFFHPRYSRKLTENSVTVTRKLLSWPQWLDEALCPQADLDAGRCQHVSLGRSPRRRWISPGHWEQKVRRKSKDMGKIIRLCHVSCWDVTEDFLHTLPEAESDQHSVLIGGTPLSLSPTPQTSHHLGPVQDQVVVNSDIVDLLLVMVNVNGVLNVWSEYLVSVLLCHTGVGVITGGYCLTYRRIWSDDNKTNIY